MTNNLYPVFFLPGPSVDENKFNAHLDEHIHEVLQVPGFEACRRYHLTNSKGDGYPSQYTYLNLYEVSGTADETTRALDAPSDRPKHPEFWSDVKRSPCFAELITGELDPTTAEKLFAVFTSRYESMTPAEYEEWYAEHAAGNVRSTSLLGQVSRYRVRVVTVREDVYPEHLAIYSLGGTAAEMLAETHAAQKKGEVSESEGLNVFASLEATPIGDAAVR